ncbi:DUF402 domain-containing protein [Caldibacillus lycopersici]|uniref:DUF402 domain-containing protein n=1 Tax=Perspicuibacillus lycopersici TaxID=1325689 RepID=A0AAE3LTX4_9BACI|nr:DUF402 domain-containing protein [Perspicuibacillus lycopersici]MCU9614668.1 DUF402 domain-containing protein [Perspicuibacillus lycopersici]
MLKRKYGNRSEWKRVKESRYAQTCVETETFRGYITLLQIDRVEAPLYITYETKQICIVDDGYSWLQHFPLDQKFSITTMFNGNGEVIQHYIDIITGVGTDNGIPWMEDLFLDIILLPTGEMYRKDADELEEAYSLGIIDQSLYELAQEIANRLTQLILNKNFEILNLMIEHKNILDQMIERKK